MAVGSHQRLHQRVLTRGMTGSNLHFKKTHLAALCRIRGAGQSNRGQREPNEVREGGKVVTLESWPGEHCTKALSAVPLRAASAQKGAF